jgi:polysaccharide biosynthesis protein PelE
LILHFIRPWEILEDNIQSADYPDHQRSPQQRNMVFGEGMGAKAVSTPSMSKGVRENMLVAINQFETPGVNAMNTQALSDDVDEIRLFARSLIEKQERRISEQLKAINQHLEHPENALKTAYYKRLKALVIWEQVYRHLVNFEHLTAALEHIKILATEAFQELPKDVELPLLLAKVALREQNLTEAGTWLKLATKNHAPDYKTVSYLAEIDYKEKKYANIKRTLGSMNNQGVIGLQPIISFWAAHD